MKLSILDLAPVNSGSAFEALQASRELAVLADERGYSRYWMAEHHGFENLACPAPEVMLGYLGAYTKNIRLGAGAILLPHYKPYKVAETFNMLATLFPGRIDIGVGRAPGGSPEASIALSGNFLENVKDFPHSLQTLLHFLQDDFDERDFFSKTKAMPVPEISPVPWLLGTSEKSARRAASYGMGYVFGHFMSDKETGEILNLYQREFLTGFHFAKPYTILAVNAVCAETTEKAEQIAFSVNKRQVLTEKEKRRNGETVELQLTKEEELEVHRKREKMVAGNPTEVKEQLLHIQSKYPIDEIMLVTFTDSYKERKKSFQLIADSLLR
ncbi:LLM class flavin-dependent oxidoreductase [Sediminibacillus albus]|uniref:Luciferase family oxidoreductase, group 1 n=1 Tax=Sediminibacillus albus TaxID=407036 RepID=A0A1G8VTX6_9BACI|nr:LLM class flavin-dependent oxidoreductase [Sediminibacillus albus]SDJ69504.1 luciferase family oxidoreductase, group 1 [Sediminibacillus albus]